MFRRIIYSCCGVPCCGMSTSAIDPATIDRQQQQQWMSVAIKHPNSTKTSYWNSFEPTDRFKEQSSINVWLNNNIIRTKTVWTHCICYNDQLPEGHKECRFMHGINNSGHCKGLVIWNADRVGWLIHSVPRFPEVPDDCGGDPTHLSGLLTALAVPSGQNIYGQSFIYMEFERSRLSAVFYQLAVMSAQLYYILTPSVEARAVVEAEILRCFRKTERDLVNIYTFSRGVSHYAKSRFHRVDIYDELWTINGVSTTNRDTGQLTYKRVGLLCETWQRGNEIENTERCVSFTKLARWVSHEDHSKWAISRPFTGAGASRNSTDADDGEDDGGASRFSIFRRSSSSNGGSGNNKQEKNIYRVCIGDLNRMTTQLGRGGGGVVIDGNQSLWSCFVALAF